MAYNAKDGERLLTENKNLLIQTKLYCGCSFYFFFFLNLLIFLLNILNYLFLVTWNILYITLMSWNIIINNMWQKFQFLHKMGPEVWTQVN